MSYDFWISDNLVDSNGKSIHSNALNFWSDFQAIAQKLDHCVWNSDFLMVTHLLLRTFKKQTKSARIQIMAWKPKKV